MKNAIIFLLVFLSGIFLYSCDPEYPTLPEDKIETGVFTDSRDGREYKWVKIGEQTWMAENLAFKSDTGCVAYDNDTNNIDKYGYLYNWNTALNVAPPGWHLPSDMEWETLAEHLVAYRYAFDGKMGIAKAMATNEGWDSTDIKGAVGNTDYPELINKSGFSALPAGMLSNPYNEFINMGKTAMFWSSTEFNEDCAVDRELSYKGTQLTRQYATWKIHYISVRCIKDN